MSEFLDAAELLIKRFRRPMHARELSELALEEGLFSDKFHGATPHKTMQARLSEEIVEGGQSSRFVRTRPGEFFLRELLRVNPEARKLAAYFRARPRRPASAIERVLVIPTALLDQTDRFQGITMRWRKFLKKHIRPGTVSYLDRMAAEATEEYKQVLTYILVRRGRELLTFKRGNFNRVASFLRGSQCVGFGGHVTEHDLTLFDFDDFGIRNNAIRELGEELSLPDEDLRRLATGVGLEVLGILNDDSSSVGRRHVAVVMSYTVGRNRNWNTPARGETAVTALRWIDPASADVPLRDFEYWSQLCLRRFVPGVVEAQPSFRVIRKQPFQHKHLLCVIGSIGSGKSIATNVLTKEYGYAEVNSGRVVAELIGVPPVPDTPRALFQQLAWDFITSRRGPEKLAKAILEHVERRDARHAVIDGIRQRDTLQAIKRLANGFRIATVFVHTQPDIAYKFFHDREGRGAGVHDFIARCSAPVEADVPRMIDLADAVLYNWSGNVAYRDAVRNLMANVAGK